MVYSPYMSGRFRVSSPYGWRTLSGVREFHGGIDLVGADGDSDVCASVGGKVIQSRIIFDHANLTWQWGHYISVEGEDGNVIYYCHLAERYVEKGETVKAGQRIGRQGHTGYSFGDHLHFEVRRGGNRINAANYLGIQNVAGMRYYDLPTAEPDYISLVVRKCGLEPQTEEYLRTYKYAEALGEKLYRQMI